MYQKYQEARGAQWDQTGKDFAARFLLANPLVAHIWVRGKTTVVDERVTSIRDAEGDEDCTDYWDIHFTAGGKDFYLDAEVRVGWKPNHEHKDFMYSVVHVLGVKMNHHLQYGNPQIIVMFSECGQFCYTQNFANLAKKNTKSHYIRTGDCSAGKPIIDFRETDFNWYENSGTWKKYK
jgi:hypothetical protein